MSTNKRQGGPAMSSDIIQAIQSGESKYVINLFSSQFKSNNFKISEIIFFYAGVSLRKVVTGPGPGREKGKGDIQSAVSAHPLFQILARRFAMSTSDSESEPGDEDSNSSKWLDD